MQYLYRVQLQRHKKSLQTVRQYNHMSKTVVFLTRGTPTVLMQLFSTIAPWCSSGQVLMLFRTHCHLLCFLLLKQCPFKIIYIYYKPFSIIQVPEASACKVRKAVF